MRRPDVRWLMLLLAVGCAGLRAPAEPKGAAGARQATFVEAIRPGFARPGYARAVVNVPLRWQEKTGPLIGFLRRGAVVDGTPLTQGERVVAPFPRAPSDGVLREWMTDELEVWADASIAKAQIPRELAAQAGAETFHGLYRELSVEPGGPGFAFVKCGRVAVLERLGRHMRVAADYPSGELHGWIEAAAPGERDEGCDYPEVRVGRLGYQAVPRGYAALGSLGTSAFKWLEHQKGEVHFRDGAGCESWRFAVTASGKRWVRAATTAQPRAEWQYWHIDGALSLGGYVVEVPGKGMISSSAVDGYRIVDMDRDVYWALQVGPPAADGRPILAYRVSALKPWFRTLEGCLAGKNVIPPQP